jgi:hypothetical protein
MQVQVDRRARSGQENGADRVATTRQQALIGGLKRRLNLGDSDPSPVHE